MKTSNVYGSARKGVDRLALSMLTSGVGYNDVAAFQKLKKEKKREKKRSAPVDPKPLGKVGLKKLREKWENAGYREEIVLTLSVKYPLLDILNINKTIWRVADDLALNFHHFFVGKEWGVDLVPICSDVSRKLAYSGSATPLPEQFLEAPTSRYLAGLSVLVALYFAEHENIPISKELQAWVQKLDKCLLGDVHVDECFPCLFGLRKLSSESLNIVTAGFQIRLLHTDSPYDPLVLYSSCIFPGLLRELM